MKRLALIVSTGALLGGTAFAQNYWSGKTGEGNPLHFGLSLSDTMTLRFDTYLVVGG